MTHVRTQIRAAAKAALDAALPVADYRTFASRKSALNHDPNVATVDMQFLNDQTRVPEVTGDARIHIGSLYIRIQRSALEETLDDLLDQDEVEVVAALEAHDWSSILEEPPELIQSNFADDGSAGHVLGVLVLRFDVEYRINRNDPETAIP